MSYGGNNNMIENHVISCPECDSFEIKETPYGKKIYECIKCGTVFEEIEVKKDDN